MTGAIAPPSLLWTLVPRTARAGAALELDLRQHLPETANWFGDKAPNRWFNSGPNPRALFFLPVAAKPLLDRWQAKMHQGSTGLDGVGRGIENIQPLINMLRARIGEPLSFTHIYGEPQGGRLYPVFAPHAGLDKFLLSRSAYQGLKPKLILSATQRAVRKAFMPMLGWAKIEADFKSCHPAIAQALSGDAQLFTDLQSDVHMITAETLGLGCPTPNRKLGKLANLAMLFGVCPDGLADVLRHAGWPLTPHQTMAAWQTWWARYPLLAAFRDNVAAQIAKAQAQNLAIRIISQSGKTSRFSAGEVRGTVSKGPRGPRGPTGAFRTIFSAIPRAVEGDLMARVLYHFHEGRDQHEGRPLLPMYDGLVAAAPECAQDKVAEALREAGHKATQETGVPTKLVVQHRTRHDPEERARETPDTGYKPTSPGPMARQRHLGPGETT